MQDAFGACLPLFVRLILGSIAMQGRSMAEALEERWEADRVREQQSAAQPDTAVRLQPQKVRQPTLSCVCLWPRGVLSVQMLARKLR